MKNQSK